MENQTIDFIGFDTVFWVIIFFKKLIINSFLWSIRFISGQTIRCTINIFNNCGFDVYETVISLKRVHTFISAVPERKITTDYKTIGKVLCEGVKSGDRKKILGVIDVPLMTINSSENLSNTCVLTYILQIKAHIVGFLQSPKVQFKIFIGTKPLNYENKLKLMQ